MGQQQLILLVLGTVIVGVAIIVGIRAFTENSAKASVDAMTQDAIRIANDAQAWKKKPAPFGGQAAAANRNVPTDFTGATVPALGYTPVAGSTTKYSNINGCYEITPVGTASLLIKGYNAQETTEVQVSVTGLTDATIAPVTGFPKLSGGTAIVC